MVGYWMDRDGGRNKMGKVVGDGGEVVVVCSDNAVCGDEERIYHRKKKGQSNDTNDLGAVGSCVGWV